VLCGLSGAPARAGVDGMRDRKHVGELPPVRTQDPPPRKAQAAAQPGPAIPKRALVSLPSISVEVQGSANAAEVATHSPAPSASAAAPLRLGLPVSGPQQQQGRPAATVRDLMLRDPRSNTARAGLDERFEAAMGGTCVLDAADEDGVVRRYTGRWVMLDAAGQEIRLGSAMAIGAGGRSPGRKAFRCERLP
ncbi:MAG: hypothetical protein ACK5O3_17935, partial [Burkholderiales bacterium]